MSLYGIDPDDLHDAFYRAKKAEEQVKELAALLRRADARLDGLMVASYDTSLGHDIKAALAKVGGA